MGSPGEAGKYEGPLSLAEKDTAQAAVYEVASDDFKDDFSENKNYNDQMDMKRLGKKQEFNVWHDFEYYKARAKADRLSVQF